MESLDLMQQTDLSTLGVATEQLAQITMIVAVVGLVIALLNCFFGLKLVRVWVSLLGLLIGFALGYGISAYFGVSQMIALIIGLVAGIIFAGLGFKLYLAGAFLLCWVMVFGIVVNFAGVLNINALQGLNGSNSYIAADGPTAVFYAGNTKLIVALIVAAVLGLVVALIALKFVEPIIIFVTAIQGGIAAGSGITFLTELPGTYTHIVIGVILAILGIIVQFIMDSKKKAKQHLAKADKVRKENSTESEVERMRAVLDNTDKVKEDSDAHDYYDDDDEE